MIRKKISVSISLLVFTAIVSYTSGASLQYGDNCVLPEHSPDNSTVDTMCNNRESLTCQNGTCLCNDMSRMTYDPAVGICVGLAGHDCVYHSNEAHLPNYRRTHCVPYASCENRKCECWGAFFADETGRCVRRRSFMQQCRMDHQCDGRKGFICKDGLCQCDPLAASYNPELERCVGLPDKPCVNMYRECVDNYKCKLGICACRFKEVEGTDGRLKCDPVTHKYGKNCAKLRGTCGQDLTCINGKCRCPNPDYQIYDYELRVCVSLIGGPCTVLTPPSTTLGILEEDGRSNKRKNKKQNKNKKRFNASRNSTAFGVDQKILPCIPYARCLPYGPPTEVAPATPEMGRCECDKGFIETKKGKCNLPFGAHCETSSKNKRDICDDSVPLYCVNNVCSCKNENDLYEEDSKRCKKTIGGLCWKDGSCVQNARCIRYAPKLPGRCMCPPNATPDPNSSSCLVYENDVDASLGFDEEDEDDIGFRRM